VAQTEAVDPVWEVGPSNGFVLQPVSLFTYTSASGSTNVFPNSVGVESGHADGVAGDFYGMPGGVATNVAHVDNFEANYFINNVVFPDTSNINDPVVNQSFTDSNLANQSTYDSIYDDYATKFKTLFVSAIGNGGSILPPGTAYDSIGVGAYGGLSSTGPTADGRAKPDLVAPGAETSFSTPLVAGAAAVLVQAGRRGDGGSDTNSAVDIRTVKALLINGAVKPSDWTNGISAPLDARYGAGVLDLFNSYKQLAAGRRTNLVATTVGSGSPHPPTGATNTIAMLSGWDLNICTSVGHPASDAINHYYFNVTNGTAGATFTATATLTWNRQQGQALINDLDLFLYNTANSNLVASSASLVDNVEHIYIPRLPAGRYDLQILKAGGAGIVSAGETYAVAWEFFSESVNARSSGTNVVVSWPVYPDGFIVESTTNLASPSAWITNATPSPSVVTNQNIVTVPVQAGNTNRFFRLRRP